MNLDDNEALVDLEANEDKPTVALAFKLEENQYGQITYLRIYQGKLKKGMELFNTRARKKIKIGRLIKMHSSKMEDITEAGAGDIVSLFGVECVSGDTFTSDSLNYSMTSMYVPEPVISLSLKAKDRASETRMSKALGRFAKEDPTFRAYVDAESKETIIQGMGELHLDVYLERMRREYKAEIITGMPQVAYRETIGAKTEFDYTHKKQTGGSGQFARVAGYIEPITDSDSEYEFVNKIKGGSIPTEYIPSCDKGFQLAIKKGGLIGFPVTKVRFVVNDGSSHSVDSSDMAFQQASIGSFRATYRKAAPYILEPIMRVAVEGPIEFQGNIFASLTQRRGIIVFSSEEDANCKVEADVPLSEMFGYSTTLRSLTQGKAEYTMELLKYGKTPQSVSEQLIEENNEKEQKN